MVAVSKFIEKQLLLNGCPKDKIVVSYIGIPISSQEPIEYSDKDTTILFVGRLEPVKGCEYLIRAAADIQRNYPSIMLKVIGNGSQREMLEKLAEDLNCQCMFIGELDNISVRDEMRRALVLCSPSVPLENGECEALGMVCLESQTMGTPVVAFDVGGIPETIPPSLNSQLVKDIDYKSLGDVILSVITDSDGYSIRVKEGKKFVDEKFDIKVCNEERNTIYGSIL
ncbi:hypothetical protein CBQ26_01805 [Deinococcus indicus]|uniref:Glycosyl transferase family 1 domain-containing protein n=1 Tax=Deinococcus indicus TaxID=223556 RepID=A0A246BSI4_9DEIO|nr:hypothetical protein CBQ26_01805 [Deinococcus indicus]